MFKDIWLFIQSHTPLLYLTQPIWRDEAFAVLLALNPPLEILRISVYDFGFPLFYLILHYWIKLFGYSEITIRLLPFIFHLFTVYMVYQLAKHFLQKLRITNYQLPITTAVLTAVNPMLLYYAFEVRPYSLLVFLAATSMYAFTTSRRRIWVLVTTLGLYAHYYFALVILTQFLYNLLTKFQTLLNFARLPARQVFWSLGFIWNLMLGAWSLLKNNFYLILPFILFIPWTPVFFHQILASAETWRSPTDLSLWLAALGNLFTGYSGTPATFLRFAQLISFAILLSSLTVLIRNNKTCLLVFLWMIIPPLIVLSASFLLPLWVNRYLIFVAIAEIFLIMLFIYSLPKKLQIPIYLAVLGLTLVFDVWFTQYQKKMDFRTPLAQLKLKLVPTDLIAATDALIFFETQYYLLDMTNQVKLYNPEKKYIPNYVGTAIIKRDDIITELPREKVVYLVNMDTSITKINSKSQILNSKQILNSQPKADPPLAENFPNSKQF